MRTGILGILFVCMLMSVSGAEIAIRQPEKPEWKIDLTDSCVRENGVRLADHLSRRRRTVRDDAGAVFRWSVSIDAPKQNAPHGFLLEVDNGDVVESLRTISVCVTDVSNGVAAISSPVACAIA